MALEVSDKGLEIIAVKIGGNVRGTYKGLGGTFASFAYCCLDKKVIPGFHEKGLIAGAELKDEGLVLVLSGKRTVTELMDIMDIALPNIGAFPGAEVRAKYIIEMTSEE